MEEVDEEVIIKDGAYLLNEIIALEDRLILLEEDTIPRKNGEKELLKLYKAFNKFRGHRIFDTHKVDLNEIFIQ